MSRFKVQGRWLYVTPELPLEDLLDIALESSESYLEEWLLAPAHFLRPGVHKLTPHYEIGKGAIDLLLKELAAEERLSGLCLLNSTYQPYVTFHRRSDTEGVAGQVEALREQLVRRGRVRRSDLPPPSRLVPQNAWREVILKHGEWRWWGCLQGGEIVAWQ